VRPPLWCAERFGVIAGIAPYPAATQLEDDKHGEQLSFAVIVDSLDDPQAISDEYPSYPDVSAGPDRLPGPPSFIPGP